MKFRNLVLAVAAFACGSAMAQNYNYGQPPFAGWPNIPTPTLTPLHATFSLNGDGGTALSAMAANLSAKTFNSADAASNLASWTSTGRNTGTGDFFLSSVVTQGSQLASAKSEPSSLLVKRISIEDDESITKRELFWSNFSFDLATGAVSSDWKLRVSRMNDFGNIGTPEVTDFGRLTVFQATQVQGGLIVPESLATLTTNATFSGLKFSAPGADVFLTAMGLSTSATDHVAILARSGMWGSATISAAVPEPSTYALVGFGLMVVGAAARRQKK